MPDASSNRPTGRFWFPVLSLLLLLVWGFQLDWRALRDVLSAADFVLVAGAVVAYAGMYGLKAWRWGLCLERLEIRISYPRRLAAYASTAAAGCFTPGRAGELLRWGFLVAAGQRPGRAAAGVLIDRGLDAGVTVAVAACLAPWMAVGAQARAGVEIPTMVVTATRAGNIPLRVIAWIRRLLSARWLQVLSPGEFGLLGDGLRSFGGIVLVRLIGISVLLWFLNAAISLALLRSLSPTVPTGLFLAAYAWTGVASYLPFSIAGVGTRETITIALLHAHGVTPEVAVGYGLLEILFMGPLTALLAVVAAPLDRRGGPA